MNQHLFHSIVSTMNHLVKDLAACMFKSLPEPRCLHDFSCLMFILCLTEEPMISHCMQIGIVETLVFMTRLLMNLWINNYFAIRFYDDSGCCCLLHLNVFSLTLISMNTSLKKSCFIFSIMLIPTYAYLCTAFVTVSEGSPQQCSKHSTSYVLN